MSFWDAFWFWLAKDLLWPMIFMVAFVIYAFWSYLAGK